MHATEDAWHDRHMNLPLPVILGTRLCYILLLLLSFHLVLQVSMAGFQSLREQRLPWLVFHQRRVRKTPLWKMTVMTFLSTATVLGMINSRVPANPLFPLPLQKTSSLNSSPALLSSPAVSFCCFQYCLPPGGQGS